MKFPPRWYLSSLNMSCLVWRLFCCRQMWAANLISWRSMNSKSLVVQQNWRIFSFANLNRKSSILCRCFLSNSLFLSCQIHCFLSNSFVEEMSEIRRPMAAGRCFIIVGGWLELLSM